MLQKLSTVFVLFIAFTGYWFGYQCLTNVELQSYLLARNDKVVDLFFISCGLMSVFTSGAFYLMMIRPDLEACVWKSRFESANFTFLTASGLAFAVIWEYTGWKLDVFTYVDVGWGFQILTCIAIATLCCITLYWVLLAASNFTRRK